MRAGVSFKRSKDGPVIPPAVAAARSFALASRIRVVSARSFCASSSSARLRVAPSDRYDEDLGFLERTEDGDGR